MSELRFTLPDWLSRYETRWENGSDAALQLQQVIALSRYNSEHAGGA